VEIALLVPELRRLGRANKLSNPIRILGPCGGQTALDTCLTALSWIQCLKQGCGGVSSLQSLHSLGSVTLV
jgi:hypothetical protein